MINKLSEFGQSQPQAAYAAFTYGVRHKMIYFIRTIEGLDQYLQPLNKLIDDKFVPALFGCPIAYYTIREKNCCATRTMWRTRHTSFNKVGIRGVSSIH